MSDLLYVSLVVGFFLVAAGVVRACDSIIGPDPAEPLDAAELPPDGARVDEDRIEATAP